MNVITNLIRNEVQASGAISFARFMELALYSPGLGYYETDQARVGRTGDFHTSVSVGPVFGRLLACQFSAWARQLDLPRLMVVEAGAHNGKLAQDVLQGISQLDPDLFARLEYWLIEPSPRRRTWQEATLTSFQDRIRWCDSITQLPEVEGVIFSNELFDAFPVNSLIWNRAGSRWSERGVACDAEKFRWTVLASSEVAGPRVDPGLAAVLPDGFLTEACPLAAQWWESAARKLNKGFLLAIDYGLWDEEFLMPSRSRGTLRSYRQHRLLDDILANPGEQDITAHVRFEMLQAAGERAGLLNSRLEPQRKFLVRILEHANPDSLRWNPNELRQFQTLTHPQHFGEAFKVLTQQRA